MNNVNVFTKLKKMKTSIFFVIFGSACIIGTALIFLTCIQLYGGMCWKMPPII